MEKYLGKVLTFFEFVDSEEVGKVYILLLITIILSVYILQHFIKIKDIIVIAFILFLIYRFLK